MKNLFKLFLILFVYLSISNKAHSQTTDVKFEPVFIMITTLHGIDNVDMKEWKAAKKEFFDKITIKNDLILAQEILVNYFSPSLSDVKLITVY